MFTWSYIVSLVLEEEIPGSKPNTKFTRNHFDDRFTEMFPTKTMSIGQLIRGSWAMSNVVLDVGQTMISHYLRHKRTCFIHKRCALWHAPNLAPDCTHLQLDCTPNLIVSVAQFLTVPFPTSWGHVYKACNFSLKLHISINCNSGMSVMNWQLNYDLGLRNSCHCSFHGWSPSHVTQLHGQTSWSEHINIWCTIFRIFI